jgi:type II secretory pathway pseudopilin PulG
MKRKNGFTIIEIIVVMTITSIMCMTMAMMLLFAYKSMMRVFDQKGKSEDLISFKMKLNEQLMGASTGYFIGTNYLPGNQVRLALWYVTGGSKDPNTWNNKVTQMIAFYYYDRDISQTIRCRYSFNTRKEDGSARTDGLGNVVYTVWPAQYTGAGALKPVDSADYTDDDRSYAEVVLKNARAFQVTNHRRNIAGGTASNETTNKDIFYVDPLAGNPFAKDLLVQVYIDVDNNDIVYNSSLFFMNRNNKRPYTIRN